MSTSRLGRLIATIRVHAPGLYAELVAELLADAQAAKATKDAAPRCTTPTPPCPNRHGRPPR